MVLNKEYKTPPEGDLPEVGLNVQQLVNEELLGKIISGGLSYNDTSITRRKGEDILCQV